MLDYLVLLCWNTINLVQKPRMKTKIYISFGNILEDILNFLILGLYLLY